MSGIPREIVEREKEGVEKLTYYGVPVAELDRDEMLAALNQIAKQSRLVLNDYKQLREFEAELRERERADYFLSGGLIGRR